MYSLHLRFVISTMPIAQTERYPRKKIKQPQPHDHERLAPTGISGFSAHIEYVRQAELPFLFPAGAQAQATLYLDSSGSPPLPTSLMQAQHKDLQSHLFGNPHSQSPSGRLTSEKIKQVRTKVCQDIFGVARDSAQIKTGCTFSGNRETECQDRFSGQGKNKCQDQGDLGWELVFTSSATAALKLAAECFNFGPFPSSQIESDPGAGASASDLEQGRTGCFVHTLEAHTSLLGLREVAMSSTPTTRNLAASKALGLSEQGILEFLGTEANRSTVSSGSHLVALPLQCNATGSRSFSFLDQLIEIRKRDHKAFHILLDASSFLSSASRLDLSIFDYSTAPDLIAFSFAKIFGLTGLGGLLVKRSSFEHGFLDRKVYFGGGSLSAQAFRSSGEVWRQPSLDLAERLEDGSPNFHSIISIESSLSIFQRLFGNWDVRTSYLDSLTESLFQKMVALRHGNGERVVQIYTKSRNGTSWSQSNELEGPSGNDQGPILLFNLLAPSSTLASDSSSIQALYSVVAPSAVSRLAALANIHLRVGRHCNVGVIQNQLNATSDQIEKLWEKGVGCGVEEGESDEQGEGPSSAIRVSLSSWNTENDVSRLIDFIERFYVIPDMARQRVQAPEGAEEMTLQSLTIYPIKSAAGQKIEPQQCWRMCQTGLEFDREWCVVHLTSNLRKGEMKMLSQKKFPRMARIRPSIDLDARKMTVELLLGETEAERIETEKIWTNNGWNWSLTIDLDEDVDIRDAVKVQICETAASPRLIKTAEVIDFFSRFLGTSCTLARMPNGSSRHSKIESSHERTSPVPILFSNESPFLLLNSASVKCVKEWIIEDESTNHQRQAKEVENLDEIASRFRGNFIIESKDPNPRARFENSQSHQILPEDGFTKLAIGPHIFGILGPCRRCEMIAVDSRSECHEPSVAHLPTSLSA